MAFQHVRVHEPPRGGGSSYRMSTRPSPELVDASVRLLKALDYTGVAMVEFKVDSRTGRWALIEVNGRFWGSLPLALAAGADFPLALVQMLLEGRTAFPQTYRVGLCCRNWEGDVEWLSANLRADRSDPTLTTRPLVGVLAETLKNLTLFRERSDTFVLDDPTPAWHELSGIGRRKWLGFRGKLACRFLQSSRSRRGLAKRFRERVRVARQVLFLCAGNICRSPYAAAVAVKNLGHRLEIDSAGYLPLPGRPSPEVAVAVAAARGIDLSDHASQVLTETLVRQSHLIIVFDYANYQQFRRTYPFARDRVFPLGAIRPEGPLFIEDPWNGGAEEFERCYQEIDENLERVIEEVGRAGPTTSPKATTTEPRNLA
ncbi:Protein-tyrosine-phosphatase [Singulisphaera sp. GP187]|uniref:arsenate reductase/protein-tyrosine-phosphatase family protein n=1 Tax=Singulisphaera sp. GP187 TaxID=1882752 RepID=UPI00092C874F|nr:ATP-grasp domain-containing protein [Singulisphaera sp. GP187]SIO66901.1 Protein-tyrosine-phosphatase [Singulisphaera sp. GP187]